MQALFQTILYQPILNLFVGLYALIPDVGVIIIILTVLIRAAMYPLTAKSIAAQKSMTELQPKIDALKKKYPKKEDQQQLALETMQLYKEHKINPLGSCLPLLIQLPIFLALNWVMQVGLASTHFDLLYSFIPRPEHINPVTLGLIDLSRSQGVESLVLAVLSGVSQWWQAKMTLRKQPPRQTGVGSNDESIAVAMNQQMLYFLPIITIIVGYKFPAGLSLYWLCSTLLTIAQQYIIFKKSPPPSPAQGQQPPVIEGEIRS